MSLFIRIVIYKRRNSNLYRRIIIKNLVRYHKFLYLSDSFYKVKTIVMTVKFVVDIENVLYLQVFTNTFFTVN